MINNVLSSKYFSLFCAVFNFYFAATAFMSGSWFFFLLCAACCGLCTRNYLEAIGFWK